MKKIYFVVLLMMSFCLRTKVSAQASAYQFTAVTGTYTPVSAAATTVPLLLADDAYSASIPLGFSFTFAGTSYTSVFVNSNGFLSFKPTATATASQQRTNSAANVTNVGPAVFPLWDDEIGYAATPASSVASYEVTGASGSRVFTFEWKNWVWWYSSTNVAGSISFQVKLYEGSNTIEFVYQQESNNTLNSPTATIGIGSIATDYLVLTNATAAPLASSSTFTTTIATKPATGQIYRFTTPLPCVTPTAQPTSLSLISGGTTSIGGSFTAASPVADRYLVVRTTTNTAPVPVNGTAYATGTSAALGGFVEVASNATTFTSTALSSGTTYYYWVFSYNSQCSGGPLYYTTAPLTGSAATGVAVVSATSGNWGTPGTWVGNVVPTSADGVTIAAGHTVTVSSVASAGTLTVAATGALTASSGTLTVVGASTTGLSNSGTVNIAGGTVVIGAAGANNRRFANASGASLNVSAGMLSVFGNVAISNGSNFTQTSGLISIDGNNGGSVTNSVATGLPILGIGNTTTGYSTGTVSLTGGTLVIVDPHASATTYDLPFMYYGTPNISCGTGHTLQIGDGISTDAGGANAFMFNFWELSGGFTPGNVVVNTLTGTNRQVQSFYTNFAVGGNVTLESGEWVISSTGSMILAKDLLVKQGSIFTNPGILNLNTAIYSASSLTFNPSTFAQNISGLGTFRNLSTSPTANSASLTVNNSSAAGVTLGVPLVLSGTLTLTSGVINTTPTNLLTLGYNATNSGILSYSTASKINGPFKRWITAATGSRAFPVGSDSLQLAAINFTTAPTTGGTLTATWIAGAPNFPNAPLNEGALLINQVGKAGKWQIDAGDGLAGGAYTGTFNPLGFNDVLDYTKLVLLKRPSAGGDWTLDGIHVTTTGSNAAPVLSRTGMTGFSQFAIGGEGNVALPITVQYFTGAKTNGANNLNWKVNCYSTPSVTLVLERSSDGRNFSSINSIFATALRCDQPFAYSDVQPLAGMNYYRLKMVDADGKISYSAVVVLINKDKGLEIVSISPNPVAVNGVLNLNVTAAQAAKLNVVVVDMQGRIVAQQVLAVANGFNSLPVNVAKLNSGTYQVYGISSEGKTKVLGFVKQ